MRMLMHMRRNDKMKCPYCDKYLEDEEEYMNHQCII
jgi:uncharacterized C2H2 Zn-finger protein